MLSALFCPATLSEKLRKYRDAHLKTCLKTKLVKLLETPSHCSFANYLYIFWRNFMSWDPVSDLARLSILQTFMNCIQSNYDSNGILLKFTRATYFKNHCRSVDDNFLWAEVCNFGRATSKFSEGPRSLIPRPDKIQRAKITEPTIHWTLILFIFRTSKSLVPLTLF